MTKEAVANTLNAQPFQPCAWRLTDGAWVPVSHPDFIIVSQAGRTAVVNTQGEELKILDLGLVTAIELGSGK